MTYRRFFGPRGREDFSLVHFHTGPLLLAASSRPSRTSRTTTEARHPGPGAAAVGPPGPEDRAAAPQRGRATVGPCAGRGAVGPWGAVGEVRGSEGWID